MKLKLAILIFFCILVSETVLSERLLNTKQIFNKEQAERCKSLHFPIHFGTVSSDLLTLKLFIMETVNSGNDVLKISEQKLQLISELLSVATPEAFVQNISDAFVYSIISEMKDFKLTGKEVSSKVMLNQQLISFFYKLGALDEKQRLVSKLNNLKNV